MISYLAELPQVFKGSIHPELSRRVGICENLKMVFIIINVIIIVHVRAPDVQELLASEPHTSVAHL